MKYSIAALTFAASLAHAQVQQLCGPLVYVGALVTLTGVGQPTTSMQVTGTLSGSQPPASVTNWVASYTAWDFSSVSGVLAGINFEGNNYPLTAPSVTFTTDANANVTGWNFAIQSAGYFDGGMGNSISVTSTPAGDSITIVWGGNAPPPAGGTLTGSTSTPGKWMCLSTLVAQGAASQTQDTTLTAQVTALTAQVTSLTAQLKNVTAAYTYWEAQVPEVIAAYDYWANQARALTIQIIALNAEIAKLQAAK